MSSTDVPAFVVGSRDAGRTFLAVPIARPAFARRRIETLTSAAFYPIAIEAARSLLIKSEISCRIVAPGILYPLDHSSLIELMTTNGPIITVEESAAPFGFGAEMAALLAEENLLSQRRFGRVSASEQSIAAAKTLEDKILPQSDDIIQAIMERL